jgi:hypothetical protein
MGLTQYLFGCLALISPLVTTSCLKPGQNSKIKHKFGETNRADADVVACVYDEKASENKVADQYLKAIATEIASHNPNTFKGKFAIENICTYYQTSREVNAYATLKENMIHFNSGLINAAGSDSEIAAIMAHELAHLTMQSEHLEAAPELLLNPEWQKLSKDSHEKGAAINKEIGQLNAILFPQHDALNLVEQKLIAKWSVDQKKRGKDLGWKRRDLVSMLSNTPNAKMSHRDLPIFPGYRTVRFSDGTISADGSVAPIRPNPDSKVDINVEIAEYQKNAEAFAAEIKKSFPAEVDALYQQYDKLRPLEKQIDELWSRLQSLRAEMEEASARLDPKGVRYNWREQEADEVGLEIYLRAGFKWSDFPWLHAKGLKPDEMERCRKDHIEKNVEPKRGDDTHPENCWRVFDIMVTEARFHKEDYAPFVNNSKVSIADSKLSEIKRK